MGLLEAAPPGELLRIDPETTPTSIGVAAVASQVSGESVAEIAPICEEIEKTKYAREVLSYLDEAGDITESPNAMKSLQKGLGMEGGQKGQRLNLENAVQVLDKNGIVRTKKRLVKRSNGEDHVVYERLDTPGNFIILERESLEEYKNFQNPS